ncbi:hypothetical protein GCM10009853_029800 [Glycomyces scopariae]
MNPPLAHTRLAPLLVAVPFTAVVTGLFNLTEYMPGPLALLIGAAWGALVALAAAAVERRWPSAAARIEDALVFVGVIAFAGCGGLMAILQWQGALDSASLTGETLEAVLLPTIPYYIAVNSVLEMLVIPAVVCFIRHGLRRVLVLATAALYFAMRIWTYLAFVPARMGFAEEEHATRAMTAAERAQAADDLMVDDPRWALLLLMMIAFLVAVRLPRARPAAA